MKWVLKVQALYDVSIEDALDMIFVFGWASLKNRYQLPSDNKQICYDVETLDQYINKYPKV